ncbi:uncharacterized protein LOC132750738 [Ruditapes philippinarum]|uniref:uncharacterized protein LOC132750738 n=1 Tax=Ruditapes philippinarum TaxID=129788 RepID=UPI00295B3612|nr:uncharacterized protein LOC132750738 [Ruditapes philippinarum]
MADSMIYFLVQWEDCYMSVISPDSVLLPKKNSKWDYEEGDLIEAVYNRGKSYQAVISEVHRSPKFSAEVIVANKRTSRCESPHVIKEEIRALRRKIRKLEDRVVALESGGSSQQDNLLKLVSHLDANDVQQVLSTLCKAIFSNEELMNCSRTGKRTNQCSERGPHPPLDIVKVEKLEHFVREKTNISKDCFIKKFENMQKTLRQKKKQ